MSDVNIQLEPYKSFRTLQKKINLVIKSCFDRKTFINEVEN